MNCRSGAQEARRGRLRRLRLEARPDRRANPRIATRTESGASQEAAEIIPRPACRRAGHPYLSRGHPSDFSPNGAKGNSPGRKPWVRGVTHLQAPTGRQRPNRSRCFCRPFGASPLGVAVFPGLAPWAIFFRPVGAWVGMSQFYFGSPTNSFAHASSVAARPGWGVPS